MFFKRISVLICPILISLVLELLFYNINLIYIVLSVGLFLLLFFLKILIKEKFFSRTFFYLALLPVLLFYANVGLLLMLSSSLLKHVFVVFFALLLILYLENIFIFFYRPYNYQPYALENLSAFFNLLIFFFLIINLNAFNVFLNLPVWLLSIILILVTSLILSQSFWINKIRLNIKFAYLLIINIIILEFFWALAFLPTNFYVNAIILTIALYLIWGLLKAKLNEQLSKKIILRYVFISTILLFIVIITASWP